jgi:hypothetical protein
MEKSAGDNMKRIIIVLLAVILLSIGFYFGYQQSQKSNSARYDNSRYINNLGQLSFQEWKDGTTLVRLRKDNGIIFDVLYDHGHATDITVFHPQGHPLKNKIEP